MTRRDDGNGVVTGMMRDGTEMVSTPGDTFLAVMFRVALQLFRFRGLLATLTSRELKARYRGSVLGFLWSLANPLLLLVVYTFVFSVVFRPRTEGAQPYALFLVSGLFPWIWTSTSTLEGSMSLLANSGLIRKAVFPAELLPMVAVLSNLVHLLFAMPIVIVALAAGRILGYPVGGVSAFLVPALILLHLPLVAGLALGAAALTVHFKDARDLLANFLTLMFFLTPVLYPLDTIRHLPPVWWAVRLNPFTPFILGYQEVLFLGRMPDTLLWVQMATVSLVAWVLGAGLFERLRETLVEAS